MKIVYPRLNTQGIHGPYSSTGTRLYYSHQTGQFLLPRLAVIVMKQNSSENLKLLGYTMWIYIPHGKSLAVQAEEILSTLKLFAMTISEKEMIYEASHGFHIYIRINQDEERTNFAGEISISFLYVPYHILC